MAKIRKKYLFSYLDLFRFRDVAQAIHENSVDALGDAIELRVTVFPSFVCSIVE